MPRLWLGVGLLLLVSGCAEATLTGPALPQVQDAAKQNGADENPRIMWNGVATPVTVTGTDFHPLVRDALRDQPAVEVPTLYLTGSRQVRLQDIRWVNDNTMQGTIPAGIEITDEQGFEDMQVVAVDPAGRSSGAGAATFRVSTFQTPVIQGVTVGGGTGTVREYCGVTETPNSFDITVTGEYFTESIQAGYGKNLTAAAEMKSAAVKSVTDSTAVVTIPEGLSAGSYDVRVINQDDQQITLADAFTINFTTVGCAVVTSVFPRFAYRGEDTNLQILGSGFEATPRITLQQGEYAFAVSYPAFLTDTTIQGLLSRDDSRQPGWYSVAVTNPEGEEAFLQDAILVVDRPLPRIDSVNPETIPSENRDVTITGSYFPQAFTVAAIDADGNGYPAISTEYTSANEVVARIPGGSMPEGAFVLRLYEETEYGQVYAEYSNIVIVKASGQTGTFTIQSSTLDTARREFGIVGLRNSIGTRYLYVVGGRTDSSVKPGPEAILSSVEIAPIDAFGRVGNFYQAPTSLDTPLYGLGLVQLDGWLYAVGGSSPTGPSDLVFKARVLDPRQAPVIVDVASDNGILDAGNWLYRISAVMDAADPENPEGETLPSIEVGYILSAQGAIHIQWQEVDGADSYRIYRTSEAGARSGTQVLLEGASAEVGCSEGICSFVDNGSLSMGTDRPLPPGSLSVWTEAGELSVPRAFHVTALAYNEDKEPFIYAISGIQSSDGTGAPVSNYDFAPVTAGESLVFNATPEATDFAARRHSSWAVANENNVNPDYLAGTNWLSILAGSNAGLDSNAGEQASTQKGRVSPTGHLDSVGGMGGGQNADGRVGSGSVFAANRLFQIAGATNYQGTSATDATNLGEVTAGFNLQTFNNNGAAKLSRPRSFYGITRFNAQIFIVGGSYDDGTVTREIESVFY